MDWILCADGGRVRRVHNAAMPLCSEQSHKKASSYHGYSKLTSCMSKLDHRASMLDNVRLSTCTEHEKLVITWVQVQSYRNVQRGWLCTKTRSSTAKRYCCSTTCKDRTYLNLICIAHFQARIYNIKYSQRILMEI